MLGKSIKRSLTLFSFLLNLSVCFGQIYTGKVIDKDSKNEVEFVEIGILNHETGTISDIDGRYSIDITNCDAADTLRFSHVGYQYIDFKVSEFRDKIDKDIYLQPKDNYIETIIVDHKRFKEKTLGNNFSGDKYQGGFIQNIKGFECGVLLNIDKRAILKKLIMNVTDCAYESIYYRVNVYKETGKNKFENILSKPIYLKQEMNGHEKELSIDLTPYYVHVEGNTLVTLQHIANIGKGQLLFAGSSFKGSVCYYRTSSQGGWSKTPMKLSFRVEALVEN